MEEVLTKAQHFRTTPIIQAVCDRGYRGATRVDGIEIVLPKPPLKRDNRYQRNKKRLLCRQRAAIEPIIGHLKHHYRLSRNYLKGHLGDHINVVMSACAWNLKKWINLQLDIFLCIFIVLRYTAKRSSMYVLKIHHIIKVFL